MDEAMVGKQIHAARKRSGTTLESLAQKVGISKGHLSQIERGQAIPSLIVLRKLSEKLQIPVHELFGDVQQQKVCFIPRHKRTRITFGDSNVIFELISENRQLYAQDTAFDVIAYNVLPRTKIQADLAARNCEQLVYVVSGQVEYSIAEETIYLGSGDSVFVPNNTGYSMRNSSMNVAELILVITPCRKGQTITVPKVKNDMRQEEISWKVAGSKIRTLRKAKGMKINAFSEALGVSSTHVSRMERGLLEPSLSVLRKIATVLDVTVPELLSGSFASDIVVTTPQTRKNFSFSDQKIRASHSFCTPGALSDGTCPAMDVYLSELAGKQMDHLEYAVHEKSDEIMVVLHGTVDIIIEDSAHTLNRGDGVFIPRGTPHRVYNPGADVAQILGVMV